ncbi:MAG TPA: hypothetical protein VNM49_03675 [Paenibacillus cookii]|nr:hypothetical protein [Paenibacillus cookii]
MKFEIGDWVQGKTVDGEFIHGYIETLDAQQEIVRVRVVQSDHEEAVGKTVAVRSSWLKQLPAAPLTDRQNLESLIDLALSTWDEAWFDELTGLLEGLSSEEERGKQRARLQGSFRNRLGLFENR